MGLKSIATEQALRSTPPNTYLCLHKYHAMRFLFLLSLLLLSGRLAAQEIALRPGMRLTQSCSIKNATYKLPADPNTTFLQPGSLAAAKACIEIEGENLVIDFQNAVLESGADATRPDLFTGLALRIRGKNITLRNLRARGYKVALLASESSGLTLENCDFSYNYRPQLHSGREHEDFSDWLSYHHNEQDEWLRYGAAIYLKNCPNATVRNCRATNCQNALLLSGCNDGLFYNNTFQFNSGLGIGLYRSSRNRVMHNRLDWNVRGYSHGFYQRGQDSAALLVYEQSSENTFAYNSCTHSGDGFFLWAGQSTMDNGQGGCNDNIIFGNDFSHAPTNGVEVTFSRNRIQGNLITDCTYGIWGGYSYGSTIMGNYIANCRTGIAIEHGQHNTIRQNFFADDSTGIQCWARPAQPADWAYGRLRDTRSVGGILDRNVFSGVRKPLKISASDSFEINGENLFFNFETLLQSEQPNTNLRFIRNDLHAAKNYLDAAWKNPALAPFKSVNFSHETPPENLYAPLEIAVADLNEPDTLPDGINAKLPDGFPRGRAWIAVGSWGPYDFRRPAAIFKEILPAENTDEVPLWVYTVYTPPGKWRVLRQNGLAFYHPQQSDAPEELTIKPIPGIDFFELELEFIGDGQGVSEFGEIIPAGQPQRFFIREYLKKSDWQLSWYNYEAKNDPLTAPDAFQKLLQTRPVARQTLQNKDLWMAWWGKPADQVQADQFATVAESELQISTPGAYLLELSSDDGVRLYVDKQLVLENWSVHESETRSVQLNLGGTHYIRIEHFDAGGFSALDFRIKPTY